MASPEEEAFNARQQGNIRAAQRFESNFDISQNFLEDFISGPTTGEFITDPRSDNERALELAKQRGFASDFTNDLQRFIDIENAGGSLADFESDDNRFIATLNSLIGELPPPQAARDASQGLAGFQQDVVQGSRFEGPGGLDARVNQILESESFANLGIDQVEADALRKVQSQAGAAGLRRSGGALRDISNVSSEFALKRAAVGLGIENQQFGRQSGNFNQAINQRNLLENRRTNLGVRLGALDQDTAQARQTSILDEDARERAETQQIQDTLIKVLPQLIPAAAAASDPRLKTNKKVIGKFHKLKVYTWNWIKELKGTGIENNPTIGFMANEVLDIFPEFVHKINGFYAVDYPGVINKLNLEAK